MDASLMIAVFMIAAPVGATRFGGVFVRIHGDGWEKC